MKVSVVIPTLNEEKYLPRTLQSLLNQKTSLVLGKDWEIVIADGGSTDNTVSVARQYTPAIVTEKKRTIAAGRHAGALRTQGEFLLFTDADVIVPPQWIEEMLKGFEKKDTVCVLGPVRPHNGTISEIFFAVLLELLGTFLNFIGIHFASGSNMGVRRDAYFMVGGFDVEKVTSEDTDLVKRLSRVGKIVYRPSTVLYVSMRRVRKWGILYFIWFHATNFYKHHFGGGKCHTHYEPIR